MCYGGMVYKRCSLLFLWKHLFLRLQMNKLHFYYTEKMHSVNNQKNAPKKHLPRTNFTSPIFSVSFLFFHFQPNGQAMRTCTSNPWTQTSVRDPPSGPQGLALAQTPTTRTLSPSTLTQTPWKRNNNSNNQRKKKPR